MSEPLNTLRASEPVLSLRGISKRFGAVSALTDIDLDVHAGEVVALVGDNGAGKSTLVKILAGRPSAERGHDHFQRRAGDLRRTRAPPRPGHRDGVSGSRALREPRRRRQHLPGSRTDPAEAR